MRLLVRSRDNVEGHKIGVAQPYVLISISGPDDPPEIPENPLCLDILKLEFDDLDQPHHRLDGMDCKLFQRRDAREILDFYNRYVLRVPWMVIHCDAGISRSPAVAAALWKVMGNYDGEYFKRYIPNRRVYSLILSEYYDHEPV